MFNGKQTFKEVIEKLRNTDEEYFGDKVLKIEPLKLMTRKNSDILVVEVSLTKRNIAVFIKLFKMRKGPEITQKKILENLKKEFEVATLFYKHFEDFPGYSIQKTIAVFPDYHALVIKKEVGESLNSILGKSAKYFPAEHTNKMLSDYIYRCGQWLKIFQDISRPAADKEFSVEGLIEYVDLRMKVLLENNNTGFALSLKDRVIDYYKRQLKRINSNDLALTGIHGDFNPSNVLINNDEIIGIDLDNFAYGSVYHDLSRFCHQLDLFLHKPIFRPSTINSLKKSLLDGYNNKKLAVLPDSPMFKMFMVRHTICHLLNISRFNEQRFKERLYNRRICRKHMGWLTKTVSEE